MRRYIAALGLSMILAVPAPAQTTEAAQECQCQTTGVCLCRSTVDEAPSTEATPQNSATRKSAPRNAATQTTPKTTTAKESLPGKYAVTVPKIHAPTVAKRRARSRALSQRRHAMSAAMRQQWEWEQLMSAAGGGGGGRVSVRGYTRKDGTYVRPHTRSR